MKSKPKQKRPRKIERAQALYQKAREVSPSRQGSLVEKAKAGAQTKGLVAKLLELDSKENFLEAPITQYQTGLECPMRLGPYLLLDRLDSGGMADVFLARKQGSKGFEKNVALKCVLGRHAANHRVHELFANEARLGSRLHHPNIAEVYDFTELNQSTWLVMEYIHGRHLGSILSRSQETGVGFRTGLAIYIGMEVARALEYAHDRVDEKSGRPSPVIHRDIAPKNIMVSFQGEVKLVDFGIAKVSVKETRATETQLGQVKGTTGYMSPEQAQGLPIDARSDLFSLSVVLYEILSLRSLFPEGLPDRKAYRRYISSRIKALPVSGTFKELLLQGLSWESDERFQAARILTERLEVEKRASPQFHAKALAEFLTQTYSAELAEERKRASERELTIKSLKLDVALFPVTGEVNREPAWKRSPLILSLLILTVITTALNLILQLTPDDGWMRPIEILRKPAQLGICAVRLETTPTGARAFANSIYLGKTPLSFKMTCNESFDLHLQKEGYKTLSLKETADTPQRQFHHRLSK